MGGDVGGDVADFIDLLPRLLMRPSDAQDRGQGSGRADLRREMCHCDKEISSPCRADQARSYSVPAMCVKTTRWLLMKRFSILT